MRNTSDIVRVLLRFLNIFYITCNFLPLLLRRRLSRRYFFSIAITASVGRCTQFTASPHEIPPLDDPRHRAQMESLDFRPLNLAGRFTVARENSTFLRVAFFSLRYSPSRKGDSDSVEMFIPAPSHCTLRDFMGLRRRATTNVDRLT